MKPPIFPSWLLVLSLLASGTLFAEEGPVRIRASYTPELEATPPRMVISIKFQTEVASNKWKNAEQILYRDKGFPYDSATYILKDSNGNPLKARPLVDSQADAMLSKVDLLLAEPLNVKNEYELTVVGGNLVFKLPAGDFTNSTANLVLKGAAFERNTQRLEERAKVSNKVEFLGGSAGGVSSIAITVDNSRFLGVDWMNLRLDGKADFTLVSKERTNFFNSISAEASFYRPFEIHGRYSEASFHARMESDQAFNIVDGLLGAQYAFFPKDPVSSWLSRVFVHTNVDVGPLFIFGYDYVHNLKGETGASKINTEQADHRASGLLRWRVPIANDYDLSFPTLAGRYNIGVDFELKGVYDITAEKFLDQSWLSLVFERQNSDRFKPALVLTWARGKSAPTFQQVNALLAGLQLKF